MVDAFVDGVDLGAQGGRIKIGTVAGDRVELAVEHPDDLG
jgi:hypothetical protein